MLSKKGLSTFTIFYCLFSPLAVGAAPSLAPAHLDGIAVEDLAAPYNLQAVVLNRTVTLNWAWDPLDPGPQFLSFGYEVLRDSAVIAIVPKTAFTDFGVPVGSHVYQVRAKGGAKQSGKKVAHFSASSEPAGAEIKQTCAGPPTIQLSVEPTKKQYGAIPALRLHFVGDATVPEGCQLGPVLFHIDSGLSTERSGPLSPGTKGHFDEFIDAMTASDEPITGAATFAVSVTAKDEAGGSTSSVFSIDLQKENQFAPKQR